eukprot:16630-Eustigmatos_ZCMA.PRE.1
MWSSATEVARLYVREAQQPMSTYKVMHGSSYVCTNALEEDDEGKDHHGDILELAHNRRPVAQRRAHR